MAKILIIGTGGVGGYFGGKMARAGYDVTFVARGEHLKQIKKNGLYIKSVLGDFQINPAQVTDDLTTDEKYDWIFIATKSTALQSIVPLLPNKIKPETMVVPLLNGVMAEEDIAISVPKEQIIHAFVNIFSKIEAPGIIHHFGNQPFMEFGNAFHHNTKALDALEEILQTSDIHYVRPENIWVDKWMKFTLICSGAITTLCRSTYDEVLQNPETRNLLQQLTEEIIELGRKKGINLDPNAIQIIMQQFDGFPKGATSSMQRDFYAQKPTELEYLTGSVVKLAAQVQHPVLLNQLCYTLLKQQENSF